MVKIQLIHPPMDDNYQGVVYGLLRTVPIGLEVIASSVGPGHSIEIFDGNCMSLPEIVDSLDADIVGVSDWYSGHSNALSILKQAKSNGATTVIGGLNASHLASRILNNHSFVDYVVKGDGEVAFGLLVEGKDISSIPNLVYRKNGKVVPNPKKDAALTSLFDLEHSDISFVGDNPVTLSSIRGCIKAELDKRCSFCSIDNSFRLMDPDLVWQQIDLLNRRYGLEYFFESGDNFIVGDYPEKILDARPDHLDHVRWRFYTGPDSINKPVVDILKALNVQSVFLGVETMDDKVLSLAGKEYTSDQIRYAVDLLSGAGIQLHTPFMFGLPGESLDSLEASVSYIEELASDPSTLFLVSKAIPIVGSDLFKILASDPRVRAEYNGDLSADDSFDYNHLFRLQTELFTSAGYDSIISYMARARDCVGLDRSPCFGGTLPGGIA